MVFCLCFSVLLFVFKVAKRHFVVVQPLRHAIETRPLDAGIRETVAAFLKVYAYRQEK